MKPKEFKFKRPKHLYLLKRKKTGKGIYLESDCINLPIWLASHFSKKENSNDSASFLFYLKLNIYARQTAGFITLNKKVRNYVGLEQRTFNKYFNSVLEKGWIIPDSNNRYNVKSIFLLDTEYNQNYHTLCHRTKANLIENFSIRNLSNWKSFLVAIHQNLKLKEIKYTERKESFKSSNYDLKDKTVYKTKSKKELLKERKENKPHPSLNLMSLALTKDITGYSISCLSKFRNNANDFGIKFERRLEKVKNHYLDSDDLLEVKHHLLNSKDKENLENRGCYINIGGQLYFSYISNMNIDNEEFGKIKKRRNKYNSPFVNNLISFLYTQKNYQLTDINNNVLSVSIDKSYKTLYYNKKILNINNISKISKEILNSCFILSEKSFQPI